MNTKRLVFLFLVLAVPSSVFAQQSKLTVQWAQENPGRLTMTSGAAFGGWNGYSFKMHFDSPKLFSLRSTVLLRRENENNNIKLHSFQWSHSKPSRVLPIEMTTPCFTLGKEDDTKIIEQADAVVAIVIHHLNEEGKRTGKTDEYELTLSDFSGVSVLPKNDKKDEIEKPKGG